MPLRSRFRALPVLAAALGASLTLGGAAAPPGAPPARTPLLGHAMIAASEPAAVEAGLKVLRAGGTAADAAVAVQAVLGLVEPESSGLGGGAFMVYYDAATRRAEVFDGRETAPAAATPELFYGDDGEPLPFVTAVLSGRSTGAPGAIAMLEMAHRAHGTRPWSTLFGDAERLADDGFPVSRRLADAANGRWPQAQTPDAARYFTKADGTRIRRGDTLRNPAYADALRVIAREGAAGLLTGPIARDIVAKVHEGPIPGALTEADLAGYRPLRRAALCSPYRAYNVCAPPPPGGGVGLLEILGLLDRTDIARRGASDPQAWVTFAQESRLGYADRDRYVGDPAFTAVPTAGLLDPTYLARRAPLGATLGGRPVTPGTPAGAGVRAPDHTAEPGGTTDFTIVDARGNVVSMTTTVESIFGSGRMTHGFFLNNQLTDFSFTPRNTDGTPAANAVQAGKRPRSSMTPVIVLDGRGGFAGALGSPGGNSIIAYVAKAMVGVFGWNLPAQAALDLPNIVARGDVVSVEAGAPQPVVDALRGAGLQVRPDAGEASGLNAVIRRADAYEGGTDKRRDGAARGW